MKTIGIATVVVVIASLCGINLAEPTTESPSSTDEYRLILMMNDLLSNDEYVTLDCLLEPTSNESLMQTTYFFRDSERLHTDLDKGINIFGGSANLQRGYNRSLAGRYTCQSQVKGVGSMSSTALDLTDYYKKPTTTEPPESDNPILVFRLEERLKPDNIEIFEDVTFFCEIVPSYTKVRKRKWFFNGVELLSNYSAGVLLVDSALQLPRIERHAAGNYSCDITTVTGLYRKSGIISIRIKDKFYGHGIGTIKEKDAVRVNFYLAVGGNTKLGRIRENDNIFLVCSIKPDMKNYRSVSWIYNGKPLRSDDKVDILYTNSILVIPRIQKSSAGRYACVLEYATGSKQRSNTLTFEVKTDPTNGANPDNNPLVIADLMDLPDVIDIDDEVTFHCRIYPNTTNFRQIRWYRDGSELDHNIDDNILLTNDNRTLIIKHYHGRENDGQYVCKVEIDKANVSSIPALLYEVENKFTGIRVDTANKVIPFTGVVPTLIAKLAGHIDPNHITEFDTLFMTCDATPDATSVRTITWFFNGKEIIPNDKFDILFGNITLVLIHVGKEAVGKYVCVGVTEHGFVVPSHSVTIERVRTAPKDRINSTNIPVMVTELLDYPDFVYTEESIYFYCNIYPHYAKFSNLTWLRDGEILYNQSRYLSTSFNRRTLIISRVKTTDIANYSCCAKIENGTYIESNRLSLSKIKNVTENMHYYWNPGYAILTAKQGFPSQTGKIRKGGSVYFTCEVFPKNTPIFRITWLRGNDVIVSNIEAGIIQHHHNRTLIMHNVGVDATGSYWCMGDTKKGDMESNPIWLSVTDE